MAGVQEVEAAVGEDKRPPDLVQLCPEMVLVLKNLCFGYTNILFTLHSGSSNRTSYVPQGLLIIIYHSSGGLILVPEDMMSIESSSSNSIHSSNSA